MKRKRKMTALAAALLSAVLLSITGTAYAGPAAEAAGAVKTAAGAQAGGSAQAQEAAAQETGKVYTIRPPQPREEVEKDILSVCPAPGDLEDLKARISATETAKKTKQIILVNNHQLTMWNKGSDGTWTPIYWTYCGYGRNGLSADRTLGDETTPIGSFPLLHGFGLGDNPGTAMKYKKIGPNSWWSGEWDKTYNTWVETDKEIIGEHLIGYDPQYKYAMAIGFNIDPVIYDKGCAIFLHVKNEEQWGTAGCVSTAEDAMLKILQAGVDGAYIIIVPDKEDIGNY
ncbi:MAG: L,D-transpeptidase family protein [Clostridium sp.]|nr:L,D-transpeptidase family protein [Clostridium sp.]